ncbi:vomeronasal type-2 receptor 26-like [Pelobates fuscus]|uniref:vomeronasal type-2 receptor 26-like n=1 Tax=Pelobates fuscus TaxID=191477 RepID=UPI002FE43B41
MGHNCPLTQSYLNLLVFIFAIEKMNTMKLILRNITLGYHIFDSCTDARKAVKGVLQILSGPRKTVPNYSCMDRNKLIGLIGDHHSITTIPLAQILSVYGYSQISYGTTDYVLNDRHLYPNFFRMLQNYHVYYKIICQLLKHFGWTWVGIVASYDDTGETEELALKKYMAYYGICMAFKLKLSNYALSHAPEKTMREVQAVQNSSANVIIVFGSANYIVLKTLVIGRDIFKDKTFVFPPSWMSNDILTDYSINIFEGSLYIELYPLPLPDSGRFFEYIHPSKRPNDKLLENIWKAELKCLSPNASKNRFYETVYGTTLRKCTGKEPSINAKENLHRGVTPRVYFAVLAMCSALQRYLKMHFFGVSDMTVWEAHKSVIRGHLIRIATQRKKNASRQIMDLTQKIGDLESTHKHDQQEQTYRELISTGRQLAELLERNHARTVQRSRVLFYRHANKGGKLLARMLRGTQHRAQVHTIRTAQGNTKQFPKEIADEFEKFYTKLYNTRGGDDKQSPTTRRAATTAYLTNLQQHTITPEEAEELDSPITEEEIRQALKTAKTGKAPGPDGFPVEYFKKLGHILIPYLTKALNGIRDGHAFHRETLAATITVIPKPGKNTEQVGNYCPISLLNTDVKLFSKILARRLQTQMTRLIHPDQTDFIPGREARDCTLRLFAIQHLAKRTRLRMLLLSMDAEKAFDRVDWSFMMETLRSTGLGMDSGSEKETIVGLYTEWQSIDQQLFIISSKIKWSNTRNQMPRSQCTESCFPGFRNISRIGGDICCYDCVPCGEGEISNISDSEECIKCTEDEWPNEWKDQCIPKVVEFLSYDNDVISAVFSFFSLLLFLITIVVLVIYNLFKDTAIVKANNRNLSFILLVSIMLSYLCVFLFLGRPVDITCMLRQCTFAIIFSIAISCILGKTVMIYIVFKASKPGSAWRKWVNVKVSNSVVLIFSSIQIIINITWLIILPPFQELDKHSYSEKIIVQCNEGSVIAFYSVLGYMGFLAAVSFLIAFVARTLPDSFNEAKYITFSMLVFCSVWIAMIPAYLSTKGKHIIAVEIFAILTSSSGLLGCIFFPKCYLILFRPEINTKAYLLGCRTKVM